MHLGKFAIALGAAVSIAAPPAAQPAGTGPTPNRAPLQALKYTELPLGAVRPEGWLRQQLLTMANGATVHLDEFYAKLRDDYGWLNGKGNNWEETPYWLYNQTGEQPLLRLGDLLTQQNTPWTALLGGRDWAINTAANQTGDHWMDRHGVNAGQGLKLPVVRHQATGESQDAQALRTGWQDLMTLQGLSMGIFSADEDLHGNLPTQGVELCAIVETMYSLEQAIATTGDPLYMDALERMTYNALPTQTTDDFLNRQYFQVANQVQVKRGVSDSSRPFDRGMNNVFGPYAGYTCCTANQHQGWTKFTSHPWYGTPSGGVAALEYAPKVLANTVAGNVPLTVREDTNYSFEDQIRFTIETRKPATFPLALRILAWCEQATIRLNSKTLRTEKGSQEFNLNQAWHNQHLLTLELPMRLTTSRWAHNSRAVELGPLVYAPNLPYTQTKGTAKEECDYYEYLPAAPWNYGLERATVEHPAQNLTITRQSFQPNLAGSPWNPERAPQNHRHWPSHPRLATRQRCCPPASNRPQWCVQGYSRPGSLEVHPYSLWLHQAADGGLSGGK